MNELKFETIWFEQRKYEEAESQCHQKACCASSSATASSEAQERQASQQSSIVAQIAKARETIQQTLKGETSQRSEPSDPKDGKRLELLEKETQQLKEVIKNIQQSLSMLEEKVANIEISKGGQTPAVTAVPPVTNTQQETKPSTKPESDDDDDDDDDEDLFGSDNDEEAEKLKEIRLAQYAAKKAKKPAVIAKSNIILDVKPWDDETDMAIVEEKVRSVICDGLLWGKSKLVPVGYGIKKLQIGCVVEDDKVGVDFLEEEITKFEDLVQSVDIAAFNKV